MVPNNEFIADVCDDMSEILDPFQRERLKTCLFSGFRTAQLNGWKRRSFLMRAWGTTR